MTDKVTVTIELNDILNSIAQTLCAETGADGVSFDARRGEGGRIVWSVDLRGEFYDWPLVEAETFSAAAEAARKVKPKDRRAEGVPPAWALTRALGIAGSDAKILPSAGTPRMWGLFVRIEADDKVWRPVAWISSDSPLDLLRWQGGIPILCPDIPDDATPDQVARAALAVIQAGRR